MKVLKLMLFILVMIERSETISRLVSQAIQGIVKEYFVKNAVYLDVLVDTYEIKNLDEPLRLLSEVMSINLHSYDSRNLIPDKNLIVLHNSLYGMLIFETYAEIIGMKSSQNVLIYCKGMTTADVENHLPKSAYDFRSYLIEENNQIVLYALKYFSPHNCDVRQVKEINRYSIVSQRWTTEMFFIPIITDFFGCTLTVVLFSGYTVAPDRKSFKVEGALNEIMKMLSSNLNFAIEYNLPEEKEFKKEGSQVQIGLFIMNDKVRLDCAHVISSGLVAVVPPGEPYTPYEKLLLPFDGLTWMFLLIFFSIGFTVVIIIRLSKSPSLNEWIVGANIRNPAFNIFATLMGIPLKILPKTNVARFLLMNLILFCLIFRTAYQGKYFEFMTSNPTKKPINTIEELADKKFPIYTDYLKGIEFESLTIE